MADAVDQPLEADGRSLLLHVGGQCVEGHSEARDEAAGPVVGSADIWLGQRWCRAVRPSGPGSARACVALLRTEVPDGLGSLLVQQAVESSVTGNPASV